MNKKLVAVAIAGVLAAPLAHAQTANVTLYGRLNMDVEWVNGKILTPNATQPLTCSAANAGTVDYCLTSNPNQYRVSSNSSRFGLRGTESLGGGLSAIFQIESSLSPDISGGTLAGRDTFIGLQGAWGTFRMGRFHGPYDNIHEIWGSNPTLLTGIMATSAIWAQGFATNVQQFDDRIANSIRWDSPVWSGFQLQVQYGNAQGTNAEGATAHAGVEFRRHRAWPATTRTGRSTSGPPGGRTCSSATGACSTTPTRSRPATSSRRSRSASCTSIWITTARS